MLQFSKIPIVSKFPLFYFDILAVFCGVINRRDDDNDHTMSGKFDNVLDEIIERNKDVTTDDLQKTGKTGLN